MRSQFIKRNFLLGVGEWQIERKEFEQVSKEKKTKLGELFSLIAVIISASFGSYC